MEFNPIVIILVVFLGIIVVCCAIVLVTLIIVGGREIKRMIQESKQKKRDIECDRKIAAAKEKMWEEWEESNDD